MPGLVIHQVCVYHEAQRLAVAAVHKNSTEELNGLPLKGIRVLDSTHAIAEPIASHMVVEYSAEVLSIASSDHKDAVGMVVETGIGNRSA